MLAELLSIVGPVYLCAAVGFLWARLGRRYDTALIADLIMQVGAPCLVFSSLSAVEIEPRMLGDVAVATLVALAVMALLGGLVLRFMGLPSHTFLPPVVFMNSGNMGLPICLFAFGEEGLAYGACFFAVVSLVHFTIGQWLWSGEASISLLLWTPLTYAAVAAAAVIGFDLTVPQWLERATTLLGGFAVPLMQFSLGVSLATLRFESLSRASVVSLLRLVLGIGVGFGVAGLFGLEGVARGVFVLDCAMPVAVFNYMMAERFERAPGEVASGVVLSTLLSFLTIPLLLAWLLATGN